MSETNTAVAAVAERPKPLTFTVHGFAPVYAVEVSDGTRTEWHLALGARSHDEAIDQAKWQLARGDLNANKDATLLAAVDRLEAENGDLLARVAKLEAAAVAVPPTAPISSASPPTPGAANVSLPDPPVGDPAAQSPAPGEQMQG